MLKKRVLTAVVLIPCIVGLIFYSPPALLALFAAVITMAAGFEWCGMYEFSLIEKLSFITVLLMGLVGVSQLPLYHAIALSLLFWGVAFLSVVLYKPMESDLKPTTTKLAPALIGLLMLIPFWAAIVYLRVNYQPLILLSLLLLVWAADTGAYMVGKLIGRHKLIPLVSPNKTWEGFIGGLLLTLCVAGILVYSFPATYETIQNPVFQFAQAWQNWLMISAIIFFVSVFGDLFESMIKRSVNVKDSGNCLPGHGGMLDRIDSLLSAAPFLVFLLGT